MTAHKPLGIEALMARMPRRFQKRAKAAEELARRRREAQARRFDAAAPGPTDNDTATPPEWKDTVAEVMQR